MIFPEENSVICMAASLSSLGIDSASSLVIADALAEIEKRGLNCEPAPAPTPTPTPTQAGIAGDS